MNLENTIQQIERLYQTVTGHQSPAMPAMNSQNTSASLELELDKKIDLLVNTLQQTVALQPAMPWVPTMNIWESENNILLTFDVAGVSKEDIDVSVRGNLLTISGSKKSRSVENGFTPIRFEMRNGPFHRSIVLPIDAATAEIRSQVVNGILEIEIPKQPSEHKGTVQ